MTGAIVQITPIYAPFVAPAFRRRIFAAWRPRKSPAGRRRRKYTARPRQRKASPLVPGIL